MNTPFLVLALPRSRTAWLSQYLTYGDWICGHEELRHARSFDDVSAWFSQPCIGTVETLGAAWWRLFDRFAPLLRIVTIRRDVSDVLVSLARLGISGPAVDRVIRRANAKLDQVEARRDCLSLDFSELNTESGCARVFEYCLEIPHDTAWHAGLAALNVQINMRALARHWKAFTPQLEKLAKVAKQQSLAAMMRRPVVDADGMVFQNESFDGWFSDVGPLLAEHCVQVGEAPDSRFGKNLPLFRKLDAMGAMRIMTARCNGRMFGYLMTIVSPSVEYENGRVAVQAPFFVSKDVPGLGMRLQRAALADLPDDVRETMMRAGTRGDGPRLGTMYRRLGAEAAGEWYRLDMAAA